MRNGRKPRRPIDQSTIARKSKFFTKSPPYRSTPNRRPLANLICHVPQYNIIWGLSFPQNSKTGKLQRLGNLKSGVLASSYSRAVISSYPLYLPDKSFLTLWNHAPLCRVKLVRLVELRGIVKIVKRFETVHRGRSLVRSVNQVNRLVH